MCIIFVSWAPPSSLFPFLHARTDQTRFLQLFSFSELKEVESDWVARSPPPPILSYLWLLPSFPHTPSHVCAHTHTPHTIIYSQQLLVVTGRRRTAGCYLWSGGGTQERPTTEQSDSCHWCLQGRQGTPICAANCQKGINSQVTVKFKVQRFSHPQVEEQLAAKELDKEYAGIMGFESFRNAAAALAFGEDDENLKNKLVSISSLLP